ncbi:MAG TPA: BON domain-containing protein [Gemmatimonadales bacterium]|nr:BON domain-containing protein [Gemmatimonadales bacterium]
MIRADPAGSRMLEDAESPGAPVRYGGPLRRRDDQSEASLSGAIEELLAEHPEIDTSEIEVLVEAGEVTLQGMVEDRDMRWLVEDLVEAVSGVSLVHNRLRVARP